MGMELNAPQDVLQRMQAEALFESIKREEQKNAMLDLLLPVIQRYKEQQHDPLEYSTTVASDTANGTDYGVSISRSNVEQKRLLRKPKLVLGWRVDFASEPRTTTDIDETFSVVVTENKRGNKLKLENVLFNNRSLDKTGDIYDKQQFYELFTQILPLTRQDPNYAEVPALTTEVTSLLAKIRLNALSSQDHPSSK